MIILASASPRRKQLLSTIIDDFEVVVSDVDEEVASNISSTDVAEYLATQKTLSVSQKYPDDIVIGSDTVILYNNKIYGKAKDREDAKEMLKTFSGNTHQVITGVCISCKNKTISFSSVSDVCFYNLSENEIDFYLDSGEYIDKAGSYAIQGKGSLFVKEIRGDYNSIVGLPVSKLYRVLKEFYNI